MAFGPAEGLIIVDALISRGELEGYPHLAAVRGDLLAKAGRPSEARQEFEQAAAQTRNASERTLFLGRAARC
jgi:predicted RNA polymerase sigma factor